MSNDDQQVDALRVAVGTTNPSKLKAVEHALLKACQRPIAIHVVGLNVPSGVEDQPWGDADTRKGARNRAKAAYSAYRQEQGCWPHLAVGLEGGLEWVDIDDDDDDDDKQMYCMAWMAIYGRRVSFTVELLASRATQAYYGDRKPIFGFAKTGSFPLPPAIRKAVVEDGLELGDADDLVFGRTKSKHGSGAVGVLTGDLIDRAAYYEHALLLALVPWFRPDVFPSKEQNW